MSLLRKQPDAPAPSPGDTPPPATPRETVQGTLAAARTASMEPELAAGRAYVCSAIPIAERGLPMRKAWLAAPVTPREDVGEDFPPWDSIPSLLKVANAQIVADPDIPTTLSEPFVRYRATVNGYAEEIPRAEAALNATPHLTMKDCERHPQWQGTPFWPESGTVYRLRADLAAMGLGQDRLTDYARALAQALETLLRWSHGQKARAVPTPAPVTRPAPLAEPESGAVRWSPFTGKPY